MTVTLIEPHGFCMGVTAAVKMAHVALANGARVYGLHEIVHNETVVGELTAKGMTFVSSLDAVPDGATVLFSAHGVPPSVRARAVEKRLKTIDATCPFVTRIHRQVARFSAAGTPVVVIGHADHVEVKGIVGEYAGDSLRVVISPDEVAQLPFPVTQPLGVVCQTTLAHDEVVHVLAELRARYPVCQTAQAADVCTATRDRQEAVRAFVRAHLPARTGVLVLGGRSSSNTARLVEVARSVGAETWQGSGAEDLRIASFAGLDHLGVTAGASTPEAVVKDVTSRLHAAFQADASRFSSGPVR